MRVVGFAGGDKEVKTPWRQRIENAQKELASARNYENRIMMGFCFHERINSNYSTGRNFVWHSEIGWGLSNRAIVFYEVINDEGEQDCIFEAVWARRNKLS